MMRFHVLTVFPEMFPGPLQMGVIGRALAVGSVEVEAHDLRDYTDDRHRQVDDMQFGGGAGMVLKPEPIIRALRSIQGRHPAMRTVLMSPQGARFDQAVAREFAVLDDLLLVCGRYQGVDERARQVIGEELSVGDYVLSGGELAAMVVIEATARLVPGVVGSPESLSDETFSSLLGGGLEPPLYTRPADFEGHEVPEVLRSGNHAAIDQWRLQQSRERTRSRRPDLVRFGTTPGGSR